MLIKETNVFFFADGCQNLSTMSTSKHFITIQSHNTIITELIYCRRGKADS